MPDTTHHAAQIVAFFQIVGGFRRTLKQQFPTTTERAMASVSVFSLDVFDITAGLDCIVNTSYYTGFEAMCLLPLVLLLIIIGVYGVVRATHRASFRRQFGAGYRCAFDMPSRRRAIAIQFHDPFRNFSLWRLLDRVLDGIERVLTCRVCVRRQVAVTPGAAEYDDAAAKSDPFATVNAEDLKLQEGARAHGAGEQINRLRTLRVFWAHGSMRARIWTGLRMLRDEHNMLGSQEICSCIPRNTSEPLPLGFMTCPRGKAQMFLLSFRLRVRAWGSERAARSWSGRRIVRSLFLVH